MDRTPTHHDAELVLRLYELRREPVMRENRDKFLRGFWPKDEAEAVAVLALDHPLNVAYRQVTTYWEMAYALCKHGTLSPELLLDSSGEGLFAYSRQFARRRIRGRCGVRSGSRTRRSWGGR
jgi:hypothetical protein